MSGTACSVSLYREIAFFLIPIRHLSSIRYFPHVIIKAETSQIKTSRLNKSKKFALRKDFYHAHTDNFRIKPGSREVVTLSLHNLQALKALPIATLNEAASGKADNANVLPLHFSARGIETQQATLHNELRKITRLEMVLAIVGTMKAGKSTTINAIVGTEVLPNRNRPMTALPTLFATRRARKSLYCISPMLGQSIR
jgi:ribosome biogenesis GTPase A